MGVNAGTTAQYGNYAQMTGAVTSAIGAYSNAKSRQIALNGAADIADLNARMSEDSAQQELLRGQSAVASSTRRAGQVKGAQRAAIAANGIDLGEGSAAEVLTSTDIMKEEDTNTITANAVRAAWGQRIQGTNYKNEARSDRAGADSINPGMAAFTSLLGSSGQVASSWYAMKKSSSNSDIAEANKTDDPIYSLGTKRGWWGK